MTVSNTVAESDRISTPRTRSALFDLRSHLRLWPVAVVGLALDLSSKSLAFDRLSTEQPLILIPNVLSFRRVVNPGAMLGLGQGWGILFVLASVLALLFVLYLFAYSAAGRRSLHVGLGLVLAGALGNLYDRSFHIADAVWSPPDPKSFFLIGSDRAIICGKLLREDPGAWVMGAYPDGSGTQRHIPRSSERYVKQTPIVRDFIKIDLHAGGVELWRWVFNIADALLVCGVGLLLLNFWAEHRRNARLAAAQAASEAVLRRNHETSQ